MAGVHNADLICGARLLRPDQNGDMAGVLHAFARQIRRVLLSLSFNLHSIALTPEEALDPFAKPRVAFLQVGSHAVGNR
jgi:hypothetical protein